ncbi:MAG: MOSC domain-containing protein [Phyllobacterium sp.]
MADLFSETLSNAMDIVPVRKVSGIVRGVFNALGDDFPTTETGALDLSFEGIKGDYHAGLTRKSGGREPWYPRGTEMRNERQLSILAPDELARIADGLGLARVKAEWMGGNILIDGIAHLSMLPPRTLLFFEGGVTLRVDGQNGPCKFTGKVVAERGSADDVAQTSLDFVKVAKRLRGLVAWVEKPGIIHRGEKVDARLPEQWIYNA